MKNSDQVNERQEDQAQEAAQNLRMEAYAANDATTKVERTEDFKTGDVSQKLVDSLQRIASLSSRLPKNPQEFQLGDAQKPEDIQAFLKKITA
jgi:hypothetical protein